MIITATCPGCDKTLAIDSSYAGKKTRCPSCRGVVQLPTASTAGSGWLTTRRHVSVGRRKPVDHQHAFFEHAMIGLMVTFLPIYPLFFLLSRWDENAKPFILSQLGLVAAVASVAFAAALEG